MCSARSIAGNMIVKKVVYVNSLLSLFGNIYKKVLIIKKIFSKKESYKLHTSIKTATVLQ